MKQIIQFWRVFGISFCSLAITSPSEAQIVPDATLPVNSNVTRDGNSNIITGGTAAGSNLFHSFDQFSIPTGGAAYFNNALDIQNIISRVTGSSISNIDGLLQANGTANLFLINPNGIIFGPNAQLNIGGSFIASTASSLNFGDGTHFSAAAPQATPLLTVSVPIGLQFGGTVGSIVNQYQVTNSSGELVGLQVQPGRTLALVGGNVSLDGGSLQAPGGRVELGGLAGAGTVGLNSEGSLSFPDGVARADVSLDNGAFIDVTAEGEGNITIKARNINILGNSTLLSGIDERLGSVFSRAGNITLNATESITIENSFVASIANSLIPETSDEPVTRGSGNGGDIIVETGSLSLTNGAQLLAGTFGLGDAGNVTIRASDTVSFDGVSRIGSGLFLPTGAFAVVGFDAVGNGGNVNLTAGSLFLTNGAVLSAATSGQGNAGSINIVVSDTVSFNGGSSDGFPSGVFTNVDPGAVGNSGNVDLTAGLLFLTNGAQIAVSSEGLGDAGSVQLQADLLTLDNGALISAEAVSGQGGDIKLQVQDLLLLRSNSLISAVSGNPGSDGIDGNIKIDTRFLLAVPSENSDIVATGFGRSVGSNIQVNADGILGTKFQEEQTPESDIVATGRVLLNTLEVDTNPGLVELPAEVVDASRLIVQGCPANTDIAGRGGSKFIVTGRGGLPPTPRETLNSDTVLEDWGTSALTSSQPISQDQGAQTDSNSPTPPTPAQNVPASGWVISVDGVVTLIAQVPTVNSLPTSPTSCNRPANN